MGKGKMKKCASCGAEIAVSAKSCPKCGAKNKKPIHKRPWFIILIALVVIAAVMGGTGGSDSDDTGSTAKNSAEQEETKVTYTEYTASELMDDLNDNALKAEEKYNDQYVKLTGRLSTIDSSGEYISLMPEDDEYAIIGVTCYIKNEEQKEVVKEMSAGDSIVVEGKITGVGEVFGYYLDMDSLSGK